jgi:hypothetical protein
MRRGIHVNSVFLRTKFSWFAGNLRGGRVWRWVFLHAFTFKSTYIFKALDRDLHFVQWATHPLFVRTASYRKHRTVPELWKTMFWRKVWACLRLPGQYTTTFYIQTLEIVSIASVGFLWYMYMYFQDRISLITLCSKVIATFADHHGLLCFLTSSRSMKETATASFQED